MAKEKLKKIKVTAQKKKIPKKKLLTEAQHQKLTGSKGKEGRAKVRAAFLTVRPFGFSAARYGAQKLNEVADLVDKYENWAHGTGTSKRTGSAPKKK